ncbi:MAG TPA: prepilin-type N-terminal cleavage/methylation domain-containing protein [bacterium]
MWRRSNLARRGASPGRAAGFTLIELLAALAILSLILALAYGSFFQISGAATSLKGELEEQQELRLLLKMIADDLQSARYLATIINKPGAQTVGESGIIAKVASIGTKEFSYISFHAATQARFFRQRPPELDPGLHEIAYGVQEDTDKKTLNLVRREDYYLTPDMESGGVTIILSRKLETFSLAFLLPPDSPGSTTERWEREWNSMQRPEAGRMPRAIRIGLGLMGKDGNPIRESIDINLPDSFKVGQ